MVQKLIVVGIAILVGLPLSFAIQSAISGLTADAIPEVIEPPSPEVPAGVFNGTITGSILDLIPFIFVVGILVITLILMRKSNSK